MKKLLVLVILVMALVAAGCSSDDHSSTQADEKFAGKGCGEIIALLQQDADKFKADNGNYPSSLDQLVGKYIKAVPECPSGGKYQIDSSGKVIETYN